MAPNERYGHLTILQDVTTGPIKKGQSRHWLVRCDCGNTKVVRQNCMRSGKTKSCGCRTFNKVDKHRQYNTPLYRIYHAMKQRCGNPRTKAYANYGGKGINVCERWATFEQFAADMGPRPTPKHSLDRIDGTKGYSPDNVRWATQAEQMQNVRHNVNLTWQGHTLSLGEWSRRSGIPNSTLQYRARAGWPVERIFARGPQHHTRANALKSAPHL